MPGRSAGGTFPDATSDTTATTSSRSAVQKDRAASSCAASPRPLSPCRLVDTLRTITALSAARAVRFALALTRVRFAGRGGGGTTQ